MITIQQLHEYQNLVELESATPVICIMDENHGNMIPWMDEEKVCFACLACNVKIYPGEKMASHIKKTLRVK